SSAIACLQIAAQPLEPAREPGLDGAGAAAERRRRLLLGQVEEVAAADGEPLVGRQPADRGKELLAPLGAEELGLGGRGRVPRDNFAGRAYGEALAPCSRTPAVARLVAHDLEQPGPEGRTGAEAAERPVGLDEGVLCRLLRVGGTP